MTTLEGVIDLLREFDQLRERAAGLREKATNYLKKQTNLASPGNGIVEFIGIATQLIALQSAGRPDKQVALSPQCRALFDALNQLELSDVVPMPRQNLVDERLALQLRVVREGGCDQRS